MFEKFEQIPESGWEADSSVTLSTAFYDTTHYHDIFLVFRTNGDYPFSNFYCHYDIIGPTGKKVSDLENIVVSRKDGKWLGSGMGDLRNFELLIQKDFIVSDTGVYEFNIRQYMQVHNLQGIRDIGIMVKKGDEII